jgi:hypothetical protein
MKKLWFDSLPIHYLGMSVRIEHTLENRGLFTIGELREYVEHSHPFYIHKIGVCSAKVIEGALKRFKEKHPRSSNPLWTDDSDGKMPGPDGMTLILNPCVTKP